MKGKYILSGVMAMMAVTSAYAAPPKGFEEFRRGLMDDFSSFRNRILEHYADFLDGEWHEYESLEPTEKYSAPKLDVMPVADAVEIEEGSEQKKELMLSLGFSDVNVADLQPKADPDLLKWMRMSENLYNATPAEPKDKGTTDPMPRPSLLAEAEEGDIVTENGFLAGYNGEIFNFYGMEFGLPNVKFDIMPQIEKSGQFAEQWRHIDAQKPAEKLAQAVRKIQELTGMSDYLIFEMLMAYADGKFPEANDAAKMALVHYLLANMEYNVRIALDDNGNPFMMIPFTEEVFGRGRVRIGEDTYYLFSTPGRPHVRREGFHTATLPNENLGRKFNLRMNGLNLPMNPYHYSFEHEGLTIEGDLNQNIIPMLYRYPQMDTSGFASSMLSKDVRDDVVRQIQLQLGNMDPLQAADKLLAMIQYGFPYQTDDKNHGFEKPYFFEEILFYPKSDCEDRAVFYSYLLYNALGLEADLIAYPNHEAAALRADKVWGGDTHYVKVNGKYFISDPTYCGGPTGSCMPRFRDVQPKVDLSYTSESE